MQSPAKGLEAAAGLARLYATVRLFINFFQPSFKLAGKQREGAQAISPAGNAGSAAVNGP